MTSERRIAFADVFVWLVWGLLLADALWAVVRLVENVPVLDQWTLVPVLAGRAPFSFGWLVAQHAEHRLPLPRLIFVTLQTLTGDFRAPVFANVVCYAALAAALLVGVRRIRGRASYPDALFPMALLHLGHLSVRSGFELVFVLPVVLFCLASLAAVSLASHWRLRTAAALGVAVVLLPLCGGQGLVLGAPLATWLAVASWKRLREPAGAVPFVLAITALVVEAAFLVWWRSVPGRPAFGGALAVLTTAVEFASTGLGFTATSLWPLSGVFVVVLGAATLAMLAASRRAGDAAAAPLLASFAGVLLLLAAVGVGRSGAGPDAGHASRYSTLAVAFPCFVGLAWTRLGTPGASRIVRVLAFAFVCAGLADDRSLGIRQGERFQEESVALQTDAWLGASPQSLAKVHHGSYRRPRRNFPAWIAALAESRIAPYDLSPGERDRRLRPFYRSLRSLGATPDRIRSPHLVQTQRCLGVPSLLVHAPGEVRYRLEPGEWRVTGRFGLCPGAWEGGRTDGVRFVVRGRQTALDRVVRPLEEPLDRGLQRLNVRVHPDASGHVLLRTDPAGTTDWDWSVWTEIGLERLE